ncbi:MAG: carbohydrate binding domain-containing protein [Candidatus Njordarchaeia archaeon]
MTNERGINIIKVPRLLNVLAFLILSILLNLKPLTASFSHQYILFKIIDSTPLYLTNYHYVFVPKYTWSEFLSTPTFAMDYLSVRYLFLLFGEIFKLTAPQVAIFERIFTQFLAFLGMYLLSEYYLSRTFGASTKISLASFISGVFYGVSPSFMLGDLSRPIIEFAYASLPLIMLSFTRFILEQKYKYALLSSLLMAINIDEHFLWAGFPLLLGVYSFYVFIVFLIKEKKIKLSYLFNFFLVIILFISLVFYRVIIRYITISPYNYALTKAGVDVPWAHASILNMLRGMSHMSLTDIYVPTSSLFSFLNLLMPITLLFPIFAAFSILVHKRNSIVLFYNILFIISILPFFTNSPFKFIHYWIFFNLPFGPAFRTWRVPGAYISLSLGVLMSFALYSLFNIFRKRVGITLGMLLIISVYSWPLLTLDANGQLTPVHVPNDYLNVHLYMLNNSFDYSRAVYLPEFLYSYGWRTNLKPYWSPSWGMFPEFLVFSSPTSTIWPSGWWGHFYDFTLSPFYYSLLKTGYVTILPYFLKWVDIEYVVIHNDIPSMNNTMRGYIYALNNSAKFKLVFRDGFVYVFKSNISTEKKVNIPTQLILVDGGYRIIKKFYYALKNQSCDSDMRYAFIFIDQKPSQSILNNIGIMLSDKPKEQLVMDVTFNKILYEHPEYIIWPYEYIVEYAPRYKWSRASYLDPHQQVWHPYVNWQDYAWDFDYMKGIAFTINSNDSFVISPNIEHSGKYVLLVRFFANEKWGKIALTIEDKTFEIKTRDDYNGFLWYKTFMSLGEGKTKLSIKNIDGFNAVSAIVIVPKDYYDKVMKEAIQYISSKQLINLNINLIGNPSFEGTSSGWEMKNNVKKEFRLSIDNSTSFDGNYSLKVSTKSTEPRWSWIRSNWVEVKEGEEYYLITHMKYKNVNASHIVLEAYDEKNHRVFQLGQVPPGKYGDFDWRTYKWKFIIPENVTKIRVVLNAGWVLDKNKGDAITWFDDIRLIPLKSEHIPLNLSKIREPPAEVISYQKINPILWKVKVNATKPFFLTFAESYDPLWEARVYKDGKLVEKVSPVPTYGVINGFWINQTGDLEIVLRYTPQGWFERGLIISLATFILSIFYITYDWRREKGDRWAKRLERKAKKFLDKLKQG